MNINIISDEPAYVYFDFKISNISVNIVINRIKKILLFLLKYLDR